MMPVPKADTAWRQLELKNINYSQVCEPIVPEVQSLLKGSLQDPVQGPKFFRHAAQDVSLEIKLSIHLNKNKLQQGFLHICMCFCHLSVVLTQATFPKFSSFQRQHLEKQTHMVALTGRTDEEG